MSLPVRIAAVVLGFAAALYGTASLPGGWLATPPWWERAAPMETLAWYHRYHPSWGVSERVISKHEGESEADDAASVPETEEIRVTDVVVLTWSQATEKALRHVEPRDGREWISGGVVAAGLALAAFGAWPRRRPVTTTSLPTDRV